MDGFTLGLCHNTTVKIAVSDSDNGLSVKMSIQIIQETARTTLQLFGVFNAGREVLGRNTYLRHMHARKFSPIAFPQQRTERHW